MKLVIDPHVLSGAFLSNTQPSYKILRKEIIETFEAIAQKQDRRRGNVRPKEFEIFISYKSQDAADALEIERFLTNRKYKVWLDRKRLKGGDQWHFEIEEAIKRAALFLSCISFTSINNEGVHNEECGQALIRQRRQPLGRGFIIPVRLQQEVPIPACKPHSSSRLAC